ncbi:hypothetical protein C5746_30170 [Streptomyces atratus]|uniref:Uncharacterized protein n=1 Tax=Streptomyces atratus TaxID=1893 RepID=A0A2Z5JMC6_STRAR|nr:hypothetical protein C5746_30170 [Streptomyces atratus]
MSMCCPSSPDQRRPVTPGAGARSHQSSAPYHPVGRGPAGSLRPCPGAFRPARVPPHPGPAPRRYVRGGQPRTATTPERNMPDPGPRP